MVPPASGWGIYVEKTLSRVHFFPGVTGMARPIRFAPAGVPLHVRSRGNQQQNVFMDDTDRRRYLDLMSRHCQEHGVRIFGYCQMTNHVHLILEPTTDDGLARTMIRLNSEH